jgi:hypothetical protein
MIFPVPLNAQTSRGTIAEPDPLFQASDPLDITFTAPFGLIDDERDRDKEYKGSLRYLQLCPTLGRAGSSPNRWHPVRESEPIETRGSMQATKELHQLSRQRATAISNIQHNI